MNFVSWITSIVLGVFVVLGGVVALFVWIKDMKAE